MSRIWTLLVVVLLAGGCTLLEEKKIDYKSAGSVPSLEVPPDLLLPAGDSRYTVPDAAPAGPTTYSAYSKERGAQPTAESRRLLPSVDKVRIERAGTQRWLIVEQPPQQVWPLLKDFWQDMGFIVNIELPEAGVMETDWAENRAKIPLDPIRSLLGKALDMLYSTAERDKFRTRLEPTSNGQGTEVYISHRGMVEVFEGTQSGGDQGQGRTMWQPRPANPELEAEMLRRLMTRLGVEEGRAKSMMAEQPLEPRASLGKASDGAPSLNLPEPFDRAWRRVGLALDRIGFVVEDRDRAAGLYYVRYADPEAGAKKDPGILSKLAFWKSEEPKGQAQRYRVKVVGADENSEVTVQNEDGSPASTDTGRRIATLLHEQLK